MATWGELKRFVEQFGIHDDSIINVIDINPPGDTCDLAEYMVIMNGSATSFILGHKSLALEVFQGMIRDGDINDIPEPDRSMILNMVKGLDGSGAPMQDARFVGVIPTVDAIEKERGRDGESSAIN